MRTQAHLGKSGIRALLLGLLGWALFWLSVFVHEGKGLVIHPGEYSSWGIGAAAFFISTGAIVLALSGYRADGPGARSLRLAIVAFCLVPSTCVFSAAIGYVGLVPLLLFVPFGVIAAPILTVVAAIRGARPWWAVLLTFVPSLLWVLVAAGWILFIVAFARAGGP